MGWFEDRKIAKQNKERIALNEKYGEGLVSFGNLILRKKDGIYNIDGRDVRGSSVGWTQGAHFGDVQWNDLMVTLLPPGGRPPESVTVTVTWSDGVIRSESVNSGTGLEQRAINFISLFESHAAEPIVTKS
jgi:hypothetical protein